MISTYVVEKICNYIIKNGSMGCSVVDITYIKWQKQGCSAVETRVLVIRVFSKNMFIILSGKR